MYHKYIFIIVIFFIFVIVPNPSFAEEEQAPCAVQNRACLLSETVKRAEEIEKTPWRDQIYRELAKSYAVDGLFNEARETMLRIETPDTKALTIRGIGMALSQEIYADKDIQLHFDALRNDAENISHPPSYAIALTYIAMAQAFSGDNDGAWKTASDMKNNALRHKAYGETAEIQAEKGDFASAKVSIEKIESLAFRNKAFATVSRLLADQKLFQKAYDAAQMIKDNPYKTAQTMQYLLDKQISNKEVNHR